VIAAVARTPARPIEAVPRYTLTRREAAASLGISINHFERKVQPELKVVLSGQLVLIPVAELERWIHRHARQVVRPSYPRSIA
jgi:excisionase family DNA binding protein